MGRDAGGLDGWFIKMGNATPAASSVADQAHYRRQLVTTCGAIVHGGSGHWSQG